MDAEYSFLADLLSTFRACNDWIKAQIIVTPWAALVASLALLLRSRRAGETPTPDVEPDHHSEIHSAELKSPTNQTLCDRAQLEQNPQPMAEDGGTTEFRRGRGKIQPEGPHKAVLDPMWWSWFDRVTAERDSGRTS